MCEIYSKKKDLNTTYKSQHNMPENYVYAKLEGSSLGVYISYDRTMAPSHGILVYRPQDHFRVKEEIPVERLVFNLNGLIRTMNAVNLPYLSVREIRLDDSSIWRNVNSFSPEEMKIEGLVINPLDRYFGEGNVSIDFRNDVEGVDDLVAEILARDIGLRKVE